MLVTLQCEAVDFLFSSPPSRRPKTLPSGNEGGSYSPREQHQSRIDYQEDPADEQFATDQGSNRTEDQAACCQPKNPKSNGDVLPHQQRAQDPSYNGENLAHRTLLSTGVLFRLLPAPPMCLR